MKTFLTLSLRALGLLLAALGALLMHSLVTQPGIDPFIMVTGGLMFGLMPFAGGLALLFRAHLID